MSAVNQQWQSKAPANTMILGEHSVVYGHPAIACAVDQYVKITWQQRTDNAIHIYSALGEHHTQIEKITVHPKLNFVVATLQAFQKQLPFGLDISIDSEFSSTIGLGSSAAVLAAMLSGLNKICNRYHSVSELFSIGHKIIIDIQGRGSGTDLAASLNGGLIYFQPITEHHPKPLFEKLDVELSLALIYCGYKTPTAEVLKMVAHNWENKTHELEMLYRSMAQITRRAFHALQQHELELFYQGCKDYQHLMEHLGVCDLTLEQIIIALNGCAEVEAAKISGSGLGDCILAIGQLKHCSGKSLNTLNNYQQISINISSQGALTELID